MKVLVIQHIDCEPLGLIEQAAPAGVVFSTLKPYRGDKVPSSLDGWEAMIILGGPMAVYDKGGHRYLEDEIRLIRKAIAHDLPTLGICLGAQLIAHAAGSRVYPGSRREVGWGMVSLTGAGLSDPLFSGLGDELPVFQLHGDTFDLPQSGALLAGNEAYANQAFRIGAHVYGLQFHMEVTQSLVRDWADEYDEYMAGANVPREEILAGLQDKCEALEPVAFKVTRRFLDYDNER